MNAALLADQKRRATPDTNGPKGESGGDAAPVTNSAGGYHRLRSNRIDDLRNQWEITDGAGMSTRFVALRDDHVRAFACVAEGVFHRAGKRHHFDAEFVSHRDNLRCIAKTDDQNRNFFFEYNFQLLSRRFGR